MKKSNILLIGALCASLAACQQDKGDLGIEQTNPQETILAGASAIGLNLDEAVAGKPIDLPKYMSINDVAFLVPMVVVSPSDDFPADATFSCTMQLSKHANYSDAIEVSSEDMVENDNPYVLRMAPALLSDAVRSICSEYWTENAPLYARFAVYATIKDGPKVRLGGDNYWYLAGTKLDFIPEVIPEIVMNTPGSNGTANGMKLMRNTKNDKEYEYQGFVSVTAPFTFSIMGSDKQIGMVSEGVAATGNNTPITLPAGLYDITVKGDGEQWTYTTTAISQVSCIGVFNGWGGDAELTPNSDFTVWSGDVDFSEAGEWKFRMNNGWDVNLGGEMNMLTFGGGNLKIAESGIYFVTLNLGTLPYTCTVEKK